MSSEVLFRSTEGSCFFYGRVCFTRGLFFRRRRRFSSRRSGRFWRDMFRVFEYEAVRKSIKSFERRRAFEGL